jgi:hypothetical protein
MKSYAVVQSGGNLNNASNAGVSYVNANNDSSNANWNICVHICLKVIKAFYNLASWQKKVQKLIGASSKSENSELTKAKVK